MRLAVRSEQRRAIGPAESWQLLNRLNRGLIEQGSATLTLEQWCAECPWIEGAPVVARRVDCPDKPASPEQRARLQVDADEPVVYRRVQLVCGALVVAEADNWYVPSRLPDAINRQLAETDTAFGRAIQSLGFARKTLAATFLWRLSGDQRIPPQVLEHRALVILADGTPLSEVAEVFARDLICPGDLPSGE